MANDIIQAWREKLIDPAFKRLPFFERRVLIRVMSPEIDEAFLFFTFYNEQEIDAEDIPREELLGRCFVMVRLYKVKDGLTSTLREWAEPTKEPIFLDVTPRQVIATIDALLAQIIPILQEYQFSIDPKCWN